MKIMLNAEQHESPDGINVSALLEELDLRGGRVAVMVNDEVIRKGRFEAHQLGEGDRVEIIHMVGGG